MIPTIGIRTGIALAGALLLPLAGARALETGDIRVSAVQAPAAPALASSVHLSTLPDGSQLVEVDLANTSGSEVALRSAEVDLPWITPEPGLLISSGGATMSAWHGRITDPAGGGAAPVSGTFLLARESGTYSLAGFLSWNTFWSKIRYESGRIVMTADGEGRLVRPGETVPLEKLRLANGPDWQDLLYGYADSIVRALDIHLKPDHRWLGWSTWDYYGRTWKADAVTENLDAVLKLLPKSNLVQIDGGWWPYRGDYTSVRDNLLPGGMKGLAAQIRAKGLTAGIHLDGMRASSSAAVARNHPDYFLKDSTGALIDNTRDREGNLYFDYSNPGTRDYMRDAIRQIRRDWGFDYIKIDFLAWGINENIRLRAMRDHPDREIVPYDRHFTSVERLRMGLAAFREGMGADAYFLACSAPFGPVFGMADGLRTGPDIAPNYQQYERCSETNGADFYLTGRVIHTDADYLVVRSAGDEDATRTAAPGKAGRATLNEAEMWADYVALFGGTTLESDDLMTLRAERQALVKAAAALPRCSRFVPLDYWQHFRTDTDPCHVLLGSAGSQVYLAFFNWSDKDRGYGLRGLPPYAGHMQIIALRGEAAAYFDPKGVQVSVPAHHAAVFTFAPGADFDRLRKALTVDDAPSRLVKPNPTPF